MSFPYRLGLNPGHVPVGLRDLTWYVAGALPQPPTKVEVPAFGDWGMLGNDRYGDCGVAGLEHLLEVDATITQEHETWADAPHTVSYYLRYTNGQDSGVVLADFLAYVRKHGYYGHTVHSYAPVSVQDIPTLHTAVWMYGGAYAGIKVTAAMQQAFQAGRAWDSSVLHSRVVGGHCVPVVGYDDTHLYVITWGKVQAISYPTWHAIATEAWAVISGEFMSKHGDGRGVSLTALEADLNKLEV